MPKPKSLLAELSAARERAKQIREQQEAQLRKDHEAEHRRLVAQQLKREEQARREAARREREAEQEQRRMIAQGERLLAARDRDQARAKAQAETDRKRRAVEERVAEAEFRTATVRDRVAALERLVQDRDRRLTAVRAPAEAAYQSRGADALVAGLQRALTVSPYPEGVRGGCAAMYRSEARELLVEYELPRQDVIPAAAGYRYVKTRNAVQPEPRKDAEIRKLYERLLARVAVRTLAEAFDATPPSLVDGIVFNGYVSAKAPASRYARCSSARTPPGRRSAGSCWTSRNSIRWPACAATSTLSSRRTRTTWRRSGRSCSSTCRSTSSSKRWTSSPAWTAGRTCWR
jgi:restriction system protein